MSPDKNIYFASDFHLGIPDHQSSLERERKIVRWLDHIRHNAEAIYLVGDIFDFWFDYRHSVPKGFVRLLGKLAELRDEGIPIYFFTGNHDLWMFGYFEEELDIPVYREPIVREYNGKKLYIGHGDGLGPGDHGYKILKKIFTNKFCQWAFSWLHPDLGIGIARLWSRRSRFNQNFEITPFLGEENEWLMIHSRDVLQKDHIDFFIFGHRHLVLDLPIGENSRFINLGDWLDNFSYAVFDGNTIRIEYFDESGA